MGTIIRFFVSTPLAALVTVVIFLALYNQISPKPFLYRTPEEPTKVYFQAFDDGPLVLCVDCGGWFRVPERPDLSNSWTDSEKAVKDPPEHAPKTPTLTAEIDTTHHNSLRYCDVDLPIIELRPPPYPERCREKGVEGRVTVRFDISKEGRPINIVILQSSDSCFNAPVITSIERRRYPPYCTPDGKPAMKAGVTETFTYVLED